MSEQTFRDTYKHHFQQDTAPTEHWVSQKDFLHYWGIEHSALVYHNFGSSVLENLEIDAPYMILYECFNQNANRATMLSFTEYSHDYVFSSIDEFKRLGERPLHIHDFFEITCVLSGTLRLQIENEIVEYHAGECCICNRSIKHRELFGTDYEIVLFMLKENYLIDLFSQNIIHYPDGNDVNLSQCSYWDLFLHPNEPGQYLPSKRYIDFTHPAALPKSCLSQINVIINVIMSELEEKASGSPYIIKGYFCKFFSLLSSQENYEIQVHQLPFSKEEQLFQDISLLIESCSERIDRQFLENRLNYNSDYINRIVKKYSGKTLNQYIRSFLLAKAAEMLIHTTLSISDICDNLGYSNRTFFNKLFAEKYHMSPNRYRQTYGN